MSAKPSSEPILSSATRSYITGVVFLTVGAIIFAVWRGPAPSAQALIAWGAAFLIGEVMRFRTPTGKGNVSMAITVHLAALPLIPVTMLLPAAWMARMTADLIIMRARWYRALFNACQVTLACFAATTMFHLLLPHFRGVSSTHYPVLVGALAGAWLAYALVNQGLVSGVLSLVSGTRYLTVWRENFGYRVEIASSTALFLLAPMISFL